MRRLTRRQWMQTSVVAASGMAADLAPFTPRAGAQPLEVVMLSIWPFTGPLADSGPLLDRGMKLAIEEWDGQVLGRPIKYITRDSETKARAATRRVEEAIDSEHVKFVIGPWSSDVALAVTEVAKRR
jgi:branched-chain amino acid transport system substrate-binding protein